MPYFPQNHPDMNGLRHLMLLYGDIGRRWTASQLDHYVAHRNRSGNPDDWFFDSFLFLNVKAPDGRDFCADINVGTTMSGEGDFHAVCSPTPATLDDWRSLLDYYLGSDGAAATLDRTIADHEKTLGGAPATRQNVVFMVPYPHVTQRSFGSLDTGRSLNFSVEGQNLTKATEQRLAAAQWYVREVRRRWDERGFRHLNLLGVYWMFETVYRGWEVDDHWLLKELRRTVREQGLRFLWIPFWSAHNVHALDDYQRYYFDVAFLQPNYMFYRSGKSLEKAAMAARRRNAGLEIEYYLELNEPIAVQDERHSRFRDYLNGGVHYGYMKDAVCAHFHGVDSLGRMRVHDDPREREFYEDIYSFVKGTYVLKPRIPRSSEGVVAQTPEDAAIALDLGGTQLRAALVSSEGIIFERTALKTPDGPDAIMDAIVALTTEMKLKAGTMSVVGIGVSSGGRVDYARGRILDSTSLIEGWKEIDLSMVLSTRTGLPVAVDNDGHCAGFAQLMMGEGIGVRSFINLVVGTGIGGAYFLEGELVRGMNNAAGEFGHISVDMQGPACSCGNRGCVELYASGSGIARRAQEAGLLTGPEHIEAKARDGDAEALRILREGGEALGAAIASLVNSLNPAKVILSGPVLRYGALYLDPLRKAFNARSMSVQGGDDRLVISSLEEAGLIGAAALAYSRFW